MIIKRLLFVLLVVSLTSTPASSRLQVNQLNGFGGSVGYSLELTYWVNRVRANGGTLDNNSINIARNLIGQMKGRSYWPKLKYLYPFLGADYIAAMCPLKHQFAAGTDILSNSNFVAGDWSISTGFQGNGTNKRFITNFSPASLGTSNSGGFGWWENSVNYSGGVFNVVMGILASGGTGYYLFIDPSSVGFGWGAAGTDNAASAVAGSNGDYYGQRVNASLREHYRNGTLDATNTNTNSASTAGELPIQLFGFNVTAGVQYWAGRCACTYFTDGTLTAQEVTDLHNDLQNYLITPTGR